MVLIHYVGPTKPWHYWASYPSAQPFISKHRHRFSRNGLLRPR
ncbi:hypothetical protein [Escherichia coli]